LHYREQKGSIMPRKKSGRRRYSKRTTPQQEAAQREIAFAAIRLLYREVLPLWRTCRRGLCRRHRRCCGEVRGCLARGWPLLSQAQQEMAFAQVKHGGPRRVPPATQLERQLRRFPPSNFVH
jgi:hypothetical protein